MSHHFKSCIIKYQIISYLEFSVALVFFYSSLTININLIFIPKNIFSLFIVLYIKVISASTNLVKRSLLDISPLMSLNFPIQNCLQISLLLLCLILLIKHLLKLLSSKVPLLLIVIIKDHQLLSLHMFCLQHQVLTKFHPPLHLNIFFLTLFFLHI